MGTVNGGLFSSTTDEWPTPDDLFSTLDAEFAFTLDAAANHSNAKCAAYYTSEQDGLTQPWTGVVWCNPPYGRGIGDWVRRGWEAAQAGATVVMLIPARTDTRYWHDYVMRANEVRLIRGRLHFAGDYHSARVESGASVAHNAPFPSAVIVFQACPYSPLVTAINRDGTRVPTVRAISDALTLGGEPNAD